MTHRIQNLIIKILHWSERYTKTDMTYLASGGFWLFISQGVNFIFSLGLVWVFANLMTQEIYGQYRFLITAASLLALTSLPGMTTAIVRAVARGNSGVIPSVVKTRLKWGFLGTLGGLVMSSYYFWQNDLSLGWLFVMIAIFVPFTESFAISQHYHNGRQNYRHYAISSIIRYSTIVISTILAIILSESLFIILITYLASTVFINVSIYLYTAKRFPFSSQGDNETIKYGKRLSVIESLNSFTNNIDKLALWYLVGPAPVAIYTIATSLPREIANTFNHIGKLALPKMAIRNKSELKESLIRKLLVFFVGTIPITLMYVLLAPTIFSIFLPQYENAVPASQLAAVLISLSPTVLLAQYFRATMHTKALYTTEVIQPVITASLFIILIPIYGVTGAIYALIAKQSILFITYLLFFAQDH